MKKIMAIFISAFLMLTVGILGACNKEKTITIIQFGNHQSLNNCYDGIIKGLEESGITSSSYKIKLEISNFDFNTGVSQANAAVSSGTKMVIAIATPSAAAAIAATKDYPSIPVIYTAVTDPKSSGFTDIENVTGSSDILDFDKQLTLIKAFLPDAKKLGVMFTSSEQNSLAQMEILREKVSDYGLTLIEKSINESAQLPAVTDSLLNERPDAIINLTDNTVVGDLENLLTKIDDLNLKIPVFGSEIEQVKKGCLASESLDYVELGRRTGLMAGQILNGEKKPSELPFITISDTTGYYNSDVLSGLGVNLPSSLNLIDVKSLAK